ncbi:MBG domain-containing protein [Myroides odoratus]|uniref:MBG domain-containing protein n=1 Tax=Myroides odoratus TaxID=256 RepID=UPI003340A745
MKKVHLTFLLPVLLLWNFLLYGQSYQALVLGGFNEDVIANGIGSAASSTTNYLDRDAFCVQSLDWKLTASSSALTFGLPVDGIINSVVSATPGLFFKLQDYSANNVIQLRSNGNSITSSVTGQVKAEKLYLLANSASGSSSLQCMVNFDDNSFQIQSIILPDWYDGTNPPVAYLGFGRVTRLSSVLEHSISNPRLHQITLPINLENQNKEIRSISFTHVQGNGIINIFGATAELVTPCKSPEIVSFSSITSSSAQVSFVPPNPLPAAGYDFEVRSSGLPDSGTTGLLGRGSIANSSATITCSSLPMGERVNFYIRSKCSAISLGEWKGPFTFTTLCAARGVFNENFESQPVGSTIDASLPSCWGKISNGNGYLYTSNASAYSGMHSLYLYNSNQTTGDLMVVSPPTNQLGNGGYRIRFRARSTFFQEVTLKVVTLENPYDTANMQMLDEIELTNSYKEYFVNVPAGTANYFGLAHGLKTGYQAIYIDDIHLEPIPPCIVPTDLTVSAVGLSTATIAWTATSSLNTDGYVYEVRTSGEAGSGTSGLAFSGRSDSNVTRVNLNNLIAGTTYHAYVKANCTATDESYWTDAVTFTPNWCMPTYQNGSSNHRITKVNIDELAFTDEITSYTQRDRTNLSIPDLQAGSSYTFNVTTTGYTVMGVAIDFNNDGFFDQNTEVLALPDYIVNNTQVYTAQVMIPNSIASGNYRMRIWNRGANAGGGMGADPCGAYNYGTWADYTVRVQEATLPPVAVNQVFCKSENKKVGDLIATGENIKWYTSETATTALLPSTLLSSGTYYATQTIGGYESVRRTAIQVEVDDPKLNSISVSSSFQYGTQTQVVLIGIRTVLGPHVLTWYETEAGGTSIPTPDINLLPVGTHAYWVSTFSTYGCESKRSKINLVVNPMSLYITPTVVNKFYGDADPELTYTIYGGYNDVPLTGSLVRDVGENAGNYAIRRGTLTASANYSLTITTAYLTILPAPLTVTADAKTKEIGAVDPILTYQVSGLKNGETAHDILLGGLTRTPGELEGIYPITQGSLALQSPNYTLTYNSANLTIESKVVTVKANTQRKSYGDADPELTYTVSGLGSTVDPETILTGSLSREPGETRGTYLITQGTLAVVSGYTLEFEGANLTIDPAVLTVTADAQTKIYGDIDPALTYTVSGLQGADRLTGSLVREVGESVGTYEIQQGSLGAPADYTLVYQGADLAITPAVLTVKANAQTKIYGDIDPVLTYTISGLKNNDQPNILTGILTRDSGEDVGFYSIHQGNIQASTNYTLAFQAASLTITPALLTVSAEAKTKVYGDADPVLTYTVSGLKNNDQPTVLTGILTRDSGEDVGFYSIHQGNIQASTNYTLAFQAASLTITPALLTVSAEAKTKVYGDADPVLTYTVSGLKNNDQPTILTGILTREVGESVGTYEIQQGSLTAPSDYTLVYQGADLAITPAVLTVKANTQTKIYGDTDPALTYTVSGLKNNDQPTILTGILTREVGESVGTYEIQQGSLTAPSDYTLVYQGADLAITPAVLTVKANTQTKIYGDTDPALTYTVSGLKNNDQPTILTGILTREVGESVGTYEIQQGSLTAPSDYTLVYQGADLAITPAVLTVKANTQTKIYGDTDPALTYTVSGLKNNDQPTILTGILTREVGESVGTYEIQQGSLSAPTDYTLVYQAADLTITPAVLTVTANAQTKIYGDTDPVLTYTVSGLKNNDQPTILTGSLVREVGESVGTYEIQQGSLSAPTDYTLVYQAADLTITPAVLTVTADAQTKVYGDTDPVLTYTVSGLKNNDQQTSISGVLVRDNGEEVGSYSITQGTIQASTNYTLAFQTANLTIIPALLTIRAEAKTKVYGDADPVLTYTVSGLKNNDQPTILTGILTRDRGEDVGTYSITQGTIQASTNYTLAFQSANLTITPALLTIRAEAKTKVYGDADPVLTYTVSGLKVQDQVAASVRGNLSRQRGENVGTYAIQQGDLQVIANYTFTFEEALLAITPAPLIIHPIAGQQKLYGATDPLFAFTVTGFKFNDGIRTALTGSLGRAAGENVNQYAYQLGSLQAVFANYSLTLDNQEQFEIKPAPLRLVVEENQFKRFGEADPVLRYRADGLQRGDFIIQAVVGQLTRSAGEAVGLYAITQGSLSARANYYIDSFIPASFEIKKNNIEGLTFPAQRFVYDGQVKQLQVQGNIQPQATIVYTNNNQTQVGQYTVTATVDYGPNYEILRLQSILTIVKADQEITWNQVSEVVLEDTPILQLTARASSNLPVSYTIDEAADREIAVVEETGLLRFLQPGFVTITASQGGNTNFNAAKTVSHTIAVSSRDASIWDLIVDGVSYGKIAKEVHLVLGCETQQDEVTFAVHTQVGAEVQPSNHFTLSVKDYGIYEQVITVQSPNKKVTETYKIVIDKRIPTEHLVIQKYNNVLLVNNNKQTNGGYVFQAYRWFKNGELAGEKQAYSAGDEYGTTLDPQATYEVELTLYNGKKIRSCPIVIKGKATANWSVYPNPVQKSQWLYVQMKEEKPGMVHYIIYNLKGQLIKRGSLEGSVKGIEIPTTVASGSYFLILKTEDTQEGVQFIIQ